VIKRVFFYFLQEMLLAASGLVSRLVCLNFVAPRRLMAVVVVVFDSLLMVAISIRRVMEQLAASISFPIVWLLASFPAFSHLEESRIYERVGTINGRTYCIYLRPRRLLFSPLLRVNTNTRHRQRHLLVAAGSFTDVTGSCGFHSARFRFDIWPQVLLRFKLTAGMGD
jgi:hypothetical protein